jgi:[protein-PII] uridylyltransferase
VADLVARTHQVLEGATGAGGPTAGAEDEGRLAGLIERSRAQGGLVVEHGEGHLALASPDRPGLFSRVAGTLSLHGLDVLAARVWSTDDGYAAEWFDVQPTFGPPDWPAVEADLRRALAGRISLEARLARRADAYRRSRPRAAVPPRTSVAVDNEASHMATVVDVRAPDAMGSLYRITRALSEMDLDIRHAKVSTLGHEVVDAFYVVDANGAKVVDAEHIAELQAAILVELGRA